MPWYWVEIGNAFFFLFSLLLPFADFGQEEEDEDAGDLTSSSDEFFGTAGNDNLVVPSDGLTTFLLDGDDSYDGSDGVDTAFGGAGNDILFMRLGDDVADGGQGDDRIDGGFGNDLINGGDGADTLNGAAGDDQVFGGTGDDQVSGSGGSDSLYGGAGDDQLTGGVFGVEGVGDLADTLFGEAGNDTLFLSSLDTGTGGAGNDSFVLEQYLEPGQAARITDYDPEQDDITLRYTPETNPDTGDELPPPELTSALNEEGTGSTVFSDGAPILQLDGITEFDVGTIAIEAVPAA